MEHNVAENTNRDQDLALLRQHLGNQSTRQFDRFSNKVTNTEGSIRNLFNTTTELAQAPGKKKALRLVDEDSKRARTSAACLPVDDQQQSPMF